MAGFRSLSIAGIGNFALAVLEAGCLVLVGANRVATLSSLGGAMLAGGATRLHSGPVRVPLVLLTAGAALVNLYVLWRRWQIRSNPAARWRTLPLSTTERRRIALVLTTSILTLLILATELIAHRILHPH